LSRHPFNRAEHPVLRGHVAGGRVNVAADDVNGKLSMHSRK
jgi:hypothetical protein